MAGLPSTPWMAAIYPLILHTRLAAHMAFAGWACVTPELQLASGWPLDSTSNRTRARMRTSRTLLAHATYDCAGLDTRQACRLLSSAMMQRIFKPLTQLDAHGGLSDGDEGFERLGACRVS
jgi:hypothetical protein